LKLRDSFDVPEEVAAGPHSPAFEAFLRNWFGDTWALTHGELDLSFLHDLSPDELRTARELIRRNLKLGLAHIIQGAAALRDVEAVPALRAMLDAQEDIDRRLIIAGALWNLVRDPVFITCLDEAKKAGGRTLAAHLYRVLWVDDERALDFLIDLLDQREREVWTLTLGLLNRLEFGQPFYVAAEKMPRQPKDYRDRRTDPAFRKEMTEAIRRVNRGMKGGMSFGWSEVPSPTDSSKPATPTTSSTT
jgi:hypothetical protein